MNTNQWRPDLDELLTVCERRAGRAEELPHCAICARYSNSSPAFDAVLSLLEGLPPEHAGAALAEARSRLSAVPASLRGQQVRANTFGVLLDSPGWPLVRSLVIDMANEETARFLSDPRLSQIEELTLLGFAYGNATAGSTFTQALLESALLNVRVLKLHSADLADADRTAFWTSPFASRLERIEGITYRGEALPHPLRATEMELRGAWDPLEQPEAVLRLLDPLITPRLRKLDLGTYYAERALPDLLRMLEKNRTAFERIEEVSFAVYGRNEDAQQMLATARLPRTVRNVSWSWHSTHGTIFSLDGEMHTVYRPDKGDRVTGVNAITRYSNLMVELANVGDLSRGLKELKLIAPPGATPADIVKVVGLFPALDRLCVVYPFSQSQLPDFLFAVKHLSRVEVLLTMQTGCSTTEYIKNHAHGYRSDATPRSLLELALAAKELSLHSDVLDVTRTSSGIEHLTLRSAEAIRALADVVPELPIETLTLETTLTADGVKALSGALPRVYRLALREGLREDAAIALSRAPQLRGIHDFSLAGYHSVTAAAFDHLISSPHLAGVLDMSLWTVPEGCDATLAAAPVLPGLVTIDLHGCERTEVIPASGRLTRLRHISEWLTLYLLEDGRLARLWLESGAAAPLIARLKRFVEWVYRVPGASVDELLPKLAELEKSDEQGMREALRNLIARAFNGTPIPEGTKFVDLNDEQQAALRAVVAVDDHYWCVCGLVSPIFKSYGLPPFERENLKKFVAGEEG